MNNDELSILITSAVNDAFTNNMKGFYIEQEQHYKDHEFVKALREISDNCKLGTIKILTIGVIKLIGFLIVLGFIAWLTNIWKHIRG